MAIIIETKKPLTTQASSDWTTDEAAYKTAYEAEAQALTERLHATYLEFLKTVDPQVEAKLQDVVPRFDLYFPFRENNRFDRDRDLHLEIDPDDLATTSWGIDIQGNRHVVEEIKRKIILKAFGYDPSKESEEAAQFQDTSPLPMLIHLALRVPNVSQKLNLFMRAVEAYDASDQEVNQQAAQRIRQRFPSWPENPSADRFLYELFRAWAAFLDGDWPTARDLGNGSAVSSGMCVEAGQDCRKAYKVLSDKMKSEAKKEYAKLEALLKAHPDHTGYLYAAANILQYGLNRLEEASALWLQFIKLQIKKTQPWVGGIGEAFYHLSQSAEDPRGKYVYLGNALNWFKRGGKVYRTRIQEIEPKFNLLHAQLASLETEPTERRPAAPASRRRKIARPARPKNEVAKSKETGQKKPAGAPKSLQEKLLERLRGK